MTKTTTTTAESDELKPPTVAELADALEELLARILAYRADETSLPARRHREHGEGPLRLISSSAFLAGGPKAWTARSIARDPVDWALRQGIRAVGQCLFDRLGDIDALRTVAEGVADRDPDRWYRRISIIDSAFNTVGEGNRRWVS